MKLFFSLAFLASLLALGCTTGIGLRSKQDESFNRPILAVYIKANPGSVQDEDLYEYIILDLKKELTTRGIEVDEDFSTDVPGQEALKRKKNFKPDVYLILDRGFKDVRRQVSPVVVSGSVSGLASLSIGSFNSGTNRFNVRLQEPDSMQDVWVATVSFSISDKRYVGKKIVRQLEADGLIPLRKK